MSSTKIGNRSASIHSNKFRRADATIAECLESRVFLSTSLTKVGPLLAKEASPSEVVRTATLDATLSKLDTALRSNYSAFELAANANGKTVAATTFHSPEPGVHVSDGQIQIEAYPKSGISIQSLANEISALGASRSIAITNAVEATVPLDQMPALSGMSDLNFARAVAYQTSAGSVTSQGDIALNAASSRTSFGVDGTGVKVGVLSDSYNHLGGAATDITNNDLPAAGVQVIEDSTSGADEGRAMLQIVHDLAPGSPLAFATANDGIAGFASNIAALKSAGCKAIVDDVVYYDEPMFQDGQITQAVDAATAGGTSYFTAAGNQSSASYESPWRTDGVNLAAGSLGASFQGGTAFDFDSRPTVTDTMQQFTLPANRYALIELQWDSPAASVPGSAGSPNDCDIYILNQAGTAVLASSINNNTGADPTERIYYPNTGASSKILQLLIVNRSGGAPGYIKDVNFGSGQFNEYFTNSGTSYGHENAATAGTVGAAAYTSTPAYGVNPPQAEAFSSRGTIPEFFSNNGTRLSAPIYRPKPDFTAVDGVSTTLASNSGLNPFFGTSAAAPHAAAIAALMYQLAPAATPAQILAAMRNGAIDMDDAVYPGFDTGFDVETGWGLIQADGALSAIGAGTAVSWTGNAGDSNWGTAGNWSNNQVPTARNDVTINVAANPVILINGNQYAHTLNDAESTNLNGTLNVGVSASFTSALGVNGTLTGGGNVITSGAVVIAASGAAIRGSGTLDVAGTLVVNGSGTLTIAKALQIEGRVSLAAGANFTLVIPSLTLAGAGTLDLFDDDLVINYAGTSPQSTIVAAVRAARNNGAWNGAGITSTTAQSNAKKNTGLGVLDGAEYTGVAGLSTFSSVPLDPTALLVKYTYNGDADFNGKVDANDYARIDSGFQNQHTAGFIVDWLSGDFNYDGKIDANDYALIDSSFQTQGGVLRGIGGGGLDFGLNAGSGAKQAVGGLIPV